jgi:hypothetical protein
MSQPDTRPDVVLVPVTVRGSKESWDRAEELVREVIEERRERTGVQPGHVRDLRYVDHDARAWEQAARARL